MRERAESHHLLTTGCLRGTEAPYHYVSEHGILWAARCVVFQFSIFEVSVSNLQSQSSSILAASLMSQQLLLAPLETLEKEKKETESMQAAKHSLHHLRERR